MYKSLALIDPESEIWAGQLYDELRRFHDGKDGAPDHIDLSGQAVILRWPGYELKAVRDAAPHVLVESQEIADRCAQRHPARERIARCGVRFDISGGPDPGMSWFNDYLFAGEALERLGTVYRFEPDTGRFLDWP
jgi:hypothetical protein